MVCQFHKYNRGLCCCRLQHLESSQREMASKVDRVDKWCSNMDAWARQTQSGVDRMAQDRASQEDELARVQDKIRSGVHNICVRLMQRAAEDTQTAADQVCSSIAS